MDRSDLGLGACTTVDRFFSLWNHTADFGWQGWDRLLILLLLVDVPPSFPHSGVVQVKALACELPHRLQLPLSRFSLSEIRREVTPSQCA
jgi:hypothetical protein